MKISFLFILLSFITFQLNAQNSRIDPESQNDLSLDSVLYLTTSHTGISNYLSRIPDSQAKLDTILFTAFVTNLDSSIQTNVVFQNIIISPTGIDTLFSSPININPYQSDTLIISTPFTFTNGKGNYSWIYSISSDSIDSNANNNFLDTANVLVTDTTFSRDINATGNFWIGHGINYEIGTMFEVFDSVRATSVSIGFGGNTPIGTIFSIRIYDSSFATPITAKEFITLKSTDLVDSISTFNIPNSVLTPGKYFVTIATFTDTLYLKYSEGANPNTVFIDSNQDGTWTTTSINPLIRLNISNHASCDLEVDIIFNEPDTLFAQVTGGNPPYSYLWDTGDTTARITNIIPSHPFSYYIVVTDDSACVINDDYSFYDNVPEIGFKGDISVFPNPNNGTFQLKITDAKSGNYAISIKNILGEALFQNTISIGGDYAETYAFPGLGTGIYVIEIKNDSNQKSVVKFIVN